MFGANPQTNEASRGPVEKPAAAEHAEQKRRFERPRPAEIPIEEAVHRCLKGLCDPRWHLAAALNAGEQVFLDGRISCVRRAQNRTEDARCCHSVLNREIDADAADRGHGMCGVAEWHGRARQPDAQDGGADQRPAAEIKGLYKSQFGSFPQAPDQAVAMVPVQRPTIPSYWRYENVTA